MPQNKIGNYLGLYTKCFYHPMLHDSQQQCWEYHRLEQDTDEMNLPD